MCVCVHILETGRQLGNIDTTGSMHCKAIVDNGLRHCPLNNFKIILKWLYLEWDFIEINLCE